jgi:hypothetical protein
MSSLFRPGGIAAVSAMGQAIVLPFPAKNKPRWLISGFPPAISGENRGLPPRAG